MIVRLFDHYLGSSITVMRYKCSNVSMSLNHFSFIEVKW